MWCSGSSSSSSTDTTITNINDASGGSRFNLSSFITNLCHEYSSSSGVDVRACISNAGSPQSLMTSGTSGGDGGGSGLKLKWLMNGTTVVSYLNQYELLHMCASSGTIIVINSNESSSGGSGSGGDEEEKYSDLHYGSETDINPTTTPITNSNTTTTATTAITSGSDYNKSSVTYIDAIKTIRLRAVGVPVGTCSVV